MKYVMWLLLLCSTLAHAEVAAPATGVELLNHCQVYTQISPMPWGYKVLDSNTSVTLCLSYMNNLIVQPAAGQEQAARSYCLPKDITADQLAAIFVTYAGQYPQSLKLETDSAVSELLGKALPCKGKP